MAGEERGYSARDLLSNRKVLVDTVLPPVVFVAAHALGGLRVAALAALVLSALIVGLRLVRSDRLVYALSGLGGVVLGVLTALWSGGAEAYFAPGMVLNAGYALAAVVSIVVRRPLVALGGWLVYRWPLRWYLHPRVRPAYSEITWLWALLFAARAWVRYVLISQGRVAWLATASVVTGWPAFAAALVVTYSYVTWRLKTLGGPTVDDFRRDAARGHREARRR